MKRHIRITLNGKSYEAVVETVTDGPNSATPTASPFAQPHSSKP